MARCITVDRHNVCDYFDGVLIEVDDPEITHKVPGWKCRACGWQIGCEGPPPPHVCRKPQEQEGQTDECRRWKHVAERLFAILDDIDTASDRFKPRLDKPTTLQNYYEYVRDVQQGRFDHVTPCPKCNNRAGEAFCRTCDGIGIVLPATAPSPAPDGES